MKQKLENRVFSHVGYLLLLILALIWGINWDPSIKDAQLPRAITLIVLIALFVRELRFKLWLEKLSNNLPSFVFEYSKLSKKKFARRKRKYLRHLINDEIVCRTILKKGIDDLEDFFAADPLNRNKDLFSAAALEAIRDWKTNLVENARFTDLMVWSKAKMFMAKQAFENRCAKLIANFDDEGLREASLDEFKRTEPYQGEFYSKTLTEERSKRYLERNN